MSNLANYSPYNKTYKFLLFQNQAYHQKNKINAKPHVRTNLRYAKNQTFLGTNPQLSQSQLYEVNIPLSKKDENKQPERCPSPSNSVARSMLFSNRSLRQSSPQIHKAKRVIHKHQSYEKFRNLKIQRDNSKLVNRLVSTSCHVIKQKKTQKSFFNHLKYRQIRKKYDSEGKRKHALVVGDQKLLCPTLKQYNQSGLASKFIERHLSWIKSTTSRTSSPMRRSNLSFN